MRLSDNEKEFILMQRRCVFEVKKKRKMISDVRCTR